MVAISKTSSLTAGGCGSSAEIPVFTCRTPFLSITILSILGRKNEYDKRIDSSDAKTFGAEFPKLVKLLDKNSNGDLEFSDGLIGETLGLISKISEFLNVS